jgi:hypothetical protein
MTIIIVCWVSLSIVFVLALLGAAARRMPRRDEEFVTAHDARETVPASKPFPAPARLATSAPTA